MAENTGKNFKAPFTLHVQKSSALNEVESAKILVQEGLIDEAKKVLHRVLISDPGYPTALELLNQIRKTELDQLLQGGSVGSRRRELLENPALIIQKLEADLGIELSGNPLPLDPAQENWTHAGGLSIRECYDLGVAFFEMGCYRDALRELHEALRLTRLEHSALNDLGVGIVALIAECTVELGEGYQAKEFLTPILGEPELNHESKLPLYYFMARAEGLLGRNGDSKSWYRKVIEMDPFYRDANFRIRLL